MIHEGCLQYEVLAQLLSKQRKAAESTYTFWKSFSVKNSVRLKTILDLAYISHIQRHVVNRHVIENSYTVESKTFLHGMQDEIKYISLCESPKGQVSWAERSQMTFWQ